MKNLIIKNLKQQYTYGATGIQDISLECDKNEVISILSYSEGGKTSFLKAIAGLYPIASGEILINGTNVENKKPKDRDVLLVYEDGGFFNRKTVYYNLGFPLKIRKVDDDDIKKKIYKVAEILNIQEILKDKIYMLTSSEKVKVMIARAMLRKASVYLFDNPFNLVDGENRHSLFIELLSHIKSLDGAIIYATDLVDEAKTISNQTYILNYGFVIDKGNFQQILDEPACIKAYSIIRGYAVNTIIARVCEENDNLFVDIFGKKIYLEQDKLINPVYIKKEIIVCFVTKESPKGISHQMDLIEYYNDIIVMHSIVNDKKIKTIINDAKNIPKYIDIEEKSIKLFDINNERSVYFG